MTDSLSRADSGSEFRLESHSDSSNPAASVDVDALVSRLQVIDDQPLAQRASAYGQLHDELRAALEGADASA